MRGSVVSYKLHPILNQKLFMVVESSPVVFETTTNSVLAIFIYSWTNFDPHYVLIIPLLQFKRLEISFILNLRPYHTISCSRIKILIALRSVCSSLSITQT